jgi:hypothetical protein
MVFACLQLLDLITTLIGFRLGGVEVSPFARWFTEMGPALGIALAKGIALLIAGICVWFHKEQVIRWANYYFAALVLWNIAQLAKALV